MFFFSLATKIGGRIGHLIAQRSCVVLYNYKLIVLFYLSVHIHVGQLY